MMKKIDEMLIIRSKQIELNEEIETYYSSKTFHTKLKMYLNIGTKYRPKNSNHINKIRVAKTRMLR